MTTSSFKKAKITGVTTAVPPMVKSIDDEVELYGGNEKQIARIKKAIGLNKRHVVTGGLTSLDLCLFATLKLFNDLNIDKGAIDGLIFVTQTPDHFQPSNAAILHGKLGLEPSVASFDVSLGCSGYVYGLWLAHMMIEAGACKNVLLLAGDTLSQCVNPRDRSTAPLFGDAGSATLVQGVSGSSDSYFSLHTDGSGSGHIVQPAGAFRKPMSEETQKESVDDDGNYRSDNDLYMNGAEVFNFAIKTEPQAIKDILEFSGKSPDDIDYIFFHQANQYIISNIIRRLKVSKSKAPSDIVGLYGNQSSASIPCTICHTLGGKDMPVDDVVLSGFGVGLSWASAVLSLKNTHVSEVFVLEK
ncbi:3-oxoacyl-[acyl-carrier-protein] synthase III C-terminal domain-containing protein [Vibrio sp. CAU 1672]|uniref:3-oxoacyl-[acyl-carrier-protein] synthase III C-terminal domain-containing protein n=1 Tax=Vibrio sp. CAU 1672 TaxID=3032594 RepID=UPI0023DABA56|nr:3-oxoacyl-[acyl-carrier-protein] synthase III C-terminal domain-containing protein [Vibrio sp. CAU 1672]MDF2153931.1 3-oxoacyl-[acyl-carrier-protein] synthase III C-terminal domain-containing protein [Vibrio sp. CAU 1672]